MHPKIIPSTLFDIDRWSWSVVGIIVDRVSWQNMALSWVNPLTNVCKSVSCQHHFIKVFYPDDETYEIIKFRHKCVYLYNIYVLTIHVIYKMISLMVNQIGLLIHTPWASYQIRKIAGLHEPGMPGTFYPPPRVSDPNMHHGTCVTHVPWCMPGSLTSGFLWSRRRGKTFPAFPAHAQPAILRIWWAVHSKIPNE